MSMTLTGIQTGPRQLARDDAHAQTHRRTSVWHAQTLDGLDSLLDQNPAARTDRDESAHPGLQPETGDADLWNSGTAEGSARLNSSSAFFPAP